MAIGSIENDEETAQAELRFSRVLVHVDGSDAGFEACRQAARLAEPEATIDAVAVVELSDAVWAAHNAPAVVEQLRREATVALERAAQLIGDRVERRFVNGPETAALLQEAERTATTLIAVGWHGRRRAEEILIGGVVGELLHAPTCSILVARPSDDPGAFPRSIAVGIDGSAAAEHALEAAESLAARLGVPLRVIAAVHGGAVDLERVRRRCPAAEEIDRQPLEALTDAARGADLLVVGSRGLTGVRALGSVSERIAHQAACSVLVARPRPAG
ncbi:MAG TPA: universal stress protein [Gaiellaceae bacterium]|jgi:nucleotide-binding universal stress UspA family protein